MVKHWYARVEETIQGLEIREENGDMEDKKGRKERQKIKENVVTHFKGLL